MKEVSGRQLQRLVEQEGFKILEIRLWDSDGVLRASVKAEKAGSAFEFRNQDREFVDYCITLHGSLDGTGRSLFRSYKDVNRYHSELRNLVVNADAKRKTAALGMSAGEISLNYSPRTLIIEFLRGRDWGSSRYLPLKRDCFATQVYVLELARQTMLAGDKILAKKPRARKYVPVLEELLRRAFRTDTDFVHNYLAYTQLLPAGLDDLSERAMSEWDFIDDQFQMLAKRGSTDSALGMRYLLDAYRRFAEWTVPCVRLISDAVRLIEQKPRCDPNLGFEKRWQVVRDSKYAQLVDCLDPQIRHSESHGATIILRDEQLVQLTDVDALGNRVILRTYAFEEVAEMTKDLLYGLFPALLRTLGAHEMALLSAVVFSRQYAEAILSIDNLK